MRNQNKKQYNNALYQPMSTNELGKIQPQAIELEEAVLGALLIESKAYQEIEDILTPNDFYSEKNQIIYKAIVSLSVKRNPIDMLTVVQELKSSGELDVIGGPLYIADLSDKIASSAHIIYHAQIINQKAKSRKLIRIASELSVKAYDETLDVEETLEELEMSLTELASNSSDCQSVSMGEALTEAMETASKTQELREKGIQVAIPTGLNTLNDILAGGWSAPDLIILGARPSMGKTQHSLSFAKAAAEAGKEVLFVSIEMKRTQLVNRYLLEDDRINSRHLKSGQMSTEEWSAMDERAGQLWNLKLNIADHHNIRYINNLKSEARRLKRKGKLQMMIVDYLGLIRTNMKFQSRQLEIGYITGELKNLAKELDIPIILLSQLNRPMKGTAIKEPQLEDLRESGDIEQDADIVLFIHKPDYYNPDVQDSKGVLWKGRGKLILSKYREGARNQPIIFHHDNRYKKIWDNGVSQSSADEYIPPVISPNTDFQDQKGDTPF
ncbi:replicative DNA helicase [Dysgonomonas sp. HDW5A]|uniref:replicative DNA helicase n=1 Tax=Dysgonomonas sp. HDW5A TaxID=2714926 RepID=UPI00140B8403|nr:replicative DNA helicase [Dysgonomonas sp. HDW5A]QIK58831.1 replicative DNA helicase [Dysgonomonas sp. HDW5A]